ncbi:DNA repair protein RecN [Pseudoruegeria sp. SHC-113]|uniref:DNA repair protein RecN n=1 Tax=Pseudoruegeria sp. SHC-113 TaxID=2855439 RepID=UPI0021BB5001|nr:DNA repair protein RecN [Pseudoruegeria sp. SHC-113]MCT8161023.1 DNA repair protein RecN [Pseudoruegeria sp. SHC-113]
MLRALDIRDMLIIDRLELAFQPGLNVLTGETGAGKSILLDSLGFVLGWRGRAELVRAGAEKGEVTAEFELAPGHPALAVLEEAGLPVEGGELILRRTNTKDGRKTAFINDRRASGEVLRQVSETLVELHGQNDDRGLLNARSHRGLLDRYAECEAEIAEVRAAWAAVRTARKALEEAEAELAEVQAEEDFLRHAVAELDKLNPEPGEDGTLDVRRRQMQAAEKIREDIARAHAALGYEGAESMLNDASRWLEGASGEAAGGLEEALAALGRAMAELGEAQQAVEGFLDGLSFDPYELEQVEERLFAIRGLARKHGVQPDDLGGFAEGLRARLEALDQGGANIGKLRAALVAAELHYTSCAEVLTGLRRKAASALDAAMAAELAPLKMERAVFTTEVTLGSAGPDGVDEVAFVVATNPGAPAGPLNKIASGGELSRFLLALKVCLTKDSSDRTMIFDEIDRGVGGATADAVGRRLAALAGQGQVLVVTHSPQVAALGGHHWRVQKTVEGAQTLSEVVPLASDERVDEIARMISGDRITPEARAAAQALLAG